MSFVFARDGDVDVEIKIYDATGSTWPATYNTLECISGDVNVTRNRTTTTTSLDNWCVTAASGDMVDATLGPRTIEIPLVIEMDPDAQLYADINVAFLAQTPIRIRIMADDNAPGISANSTHELEYEGILTNHDLNFRGGDGQTSQVAFTFHVNSEITDIVTAAS